MPIVWVKDCSLSQQAWILLVHILAIQATHDYVIKTKGSDISQAAFT